MYLPPHFQQNDLDQLCQIIENHGFGLLVSTVDGVPFASHIPMLLHREEIEGEAQLIVYGHVAKANPHWQHLAGNRSLLIFQGPHAYVSPTWYENGGVPTWNYTAIHLYGEATIVDDKHKLSEIIIQLSEQHERSRAEPWIPDFPDSMLNAIVGFSFLVDDIQGKYKLSQNKTKTDQQRVKQQLQSSPSPMGNEVGKLMQDT